MIPMRNRKKTLEVTIEEMRNFSFAYIEKYAPSKQQLRTYLLKNTLKQMYLMLKNKILLILLILFCLILKKVNLLVINFILKVNHVA